MTSAPALANASAIASTGSTIRWTSIGTGLPSALAACGRIAWQTIGPIVRFGT